MLGRDKRNQPLNEGKTVGKIMNYGIWGHEIARLHSQVIRPSFENIARLVLSSVVVVLHPSLGQTTQNTWHKAFVVFLHTKSSMSEALAASSPKYPCSRAFMDMQWCMWRRDILGLTKDEPLKQFLSLLL